MGDTPHPPVQGRSESELDGLLARAIRGDRESLIALLESVAPRVRAKIESRITGPLQAHLDADDVMQVTYLEAVTRLSKFTSGGAAGFAAWVTRLAENNLVDAIRSIEAARRPDPRRQVRPAHHPGQDSMIALVEMLGQTTSTPSRVVAGAEARRFLDAALSRLPPDYERVVRLYDLAGKPMEDVAKELGRSEGAAYMLRARAHERLREEMGDAGRFFSTPG